MIKESKEDYIARLAKVFEATPEQELKNTINHYIAEMKRCELRVSAMIMELKRRGKVE